MEKNTIYRTTVESLETPIWRKYLCVVELARLGMEN